MTEEHDPIETPLVATWDELWAPFDRGLAALPDAVRDAAVDALRGALVETAPPPATERAVFDDIGAGAGRVYYAVHGSDLQALPEVGKALATLTGILLATGSPVGAVAGLAANLVTLWWRFRRRRITLGMEQALVLRALKRAGPAGCRLDELLAVLDPGERLIIATPAELHAVLVSLSAVERFDGSASKLVKETDGVWRPLDV